MPVPNEATLVWQYKNHRNMAKIADKIKCTFKGTLKRYFKTTVQ